MLFSGSRDGSMRVSSPTQPLGALLLGVHATSSSCVAFQPGGDLLASGGDDGLVRLWDPGVGLPVATLTGHLNRVDDLAWSDDGARLVSVGADRRLVEWDLETFEVRGRSGELAAPLTSVAFAPMAERVFATGADGSLVAWDLQSGELRVVHALEAPGSSFAVGPRGRWLAAGTADGSVVVLEGRLGAVRATIDTASEDESAPDRAVTGLAFAGSGDVLVAATRGGRILRISLSARRTTREVLASVGVDRVAFSPTEDRFVTANIDGTVGVWDAERTRELLRLRGHTSEVTDVAFDPHGRRVATTSIDRTVRVWQTERTLDDLLRRRTQRALEARVAPIVEEVFEEGFVVSGALEELDERPLTDEERATAERLVRARGDDLARLAPEAWWLVTHPVEAAEEEPDPWAKADAFARLLVELRNSPSDRALQAAVLVRLGREGEALALLDRLADEPDLQPGVQVTLDLLTAWILARRGERDRAAELLATVSDERIAAAGDPNLRSLLQEARAALD